MSNYAEVANKKRRMERAQGQAHLSTTTTNWCTFQDSTHRRDYKLVVNERTLYVDSHHLAVHSSFFRTLCFGGFVEGNKGEAELKDVECDDVVEMLQILDGDTRDEYKPIDITNCVPMFCLADQWDVRVLRTKCLKFIENVFPTIPTNLSTSVRVFIGYESRGAPTSSILVLAARIASFGTRMLLEEDVWSMINNKELYCGIFAAAVKVDCEMGSDQQSLWKHEPMSEWGANKCYVEACTHRLGERDVTRTCGGCRKWVCDEHMGKGTCYGRIDNFEIKRHVDISLLSSLLENPISQ